MWSETPISKLAEMQKLFRNTHAMVAIAILLSLAGLLIGYVCQDFTWFARFGALVVAIGITLLSRASLIRQEPMSCNPKQGSVTWTLSITNRSASQFRTGYTKIVAREPLSGFGGLSLALSVL
jgi:hypothetical protein